MTDPQELQKVEHQVRLLKARLEPAERRYQEAVREVDHLKLEIQRIENKRFQLLGGDGFSL